MTLLISDPVRNKSVAAPIDVEALLDFAKQQVDCYHYAWAEALYFLAQIQHHPYQKHLTVAYQDIAEDRRIDFFNAREEYEALKEIYHSI